MNAEEILKKIGACNEAIQFSKGKSIQEAWETCPRGDWMIWFYCKKFPKDLKNIILAKAYCAKTVINLMKDERSINAINIAIAFGEGLATIDELNAANAAVNASYAANAYTTADTSYAEEQNQLETANICRKYLNISSLY